jgi:NitT/TauT family transport system permease protein
MSNAQTAIAGNPALRLVAALALGTALAIAAVLLAHRGPGGLLTIAVIVAWAALWYANVLWSRSQSLPNRLGSLAGKGVPLVFGLTLVFLWEVACVGLKVPSVLLPAPSLILHRLMWSLPQLGADFVQTFVRAAIPGWLIGSAAGFAAALACDRYDFLRRGLLPIGNFVSALPIIGIAPILVMWFGFDWQSKAAVVVVMTFFPMLVNAVAGLSASGRTERDLMHSYGASWLQTLLALRLPAAMPFLFNALKINASLALIGAIVAEFFGTPTLGMGFRISTEVGRMSLDMVWATIIVAAVAGSTFFGVLVLIEKKVTFWHPSNRR